MSNDVPGWVHDPDDTCTRACCGPTLPVSADRDAVRQRLAAALFEALNTSNPLYYDDAADELVDALLPVVDRIANERAAAELRAAADGWAKALPGLAAQLRARADALDPA